MTRLKFRVEMEHRHMYKFCEKCFILIINVGTIRKHEVTSDNM